MDENPFLSEPRSVRPVRMFKVLPLANLLLRLPRPIWSRSFDNVSPGSIRSRGSSRIPGGSCLLCKAGDAVLDW